MTFRVLEEMMQCFHHRLGSDLWQGPDYTGESGEGIGTSLVLRALGYLASNHCRAQCSFGPVVGGLDTRVLQKAQEVAPVMVPPNLVQQPLVVPVRQDPVSKMVGDGRLQSAGFRGKGCHLPSVIGLPPSDALAAS